MASVGTILSQLFPPKPRWSVDNIPDLTGKVAIVTGGNVGIGKATCKHLLLKGCTVWLAARSKAKAEEAIAELKEETGQEALFLALDLNDLRAIKESAENFKSQSTALHILICNAGFGVNALGHFLLIQHLLPSLKTTPSSVSETRIVWVSSSVQYYFRGPPVNYDILTDTPSRKRLGYHLAEVLAEDRGSNVICIVLDPGNIKTDLQRYHSPSLLRSIMNSVILYPVSKGVLSQLYAATDPAAAQYNGKYLRPWARLGEPHSMTKDEAEQQKMWDYCMGSIQEYE
ncbi:NAD(P)-binding protein [Lentinula edodes]|nr:NAD(P)-binding protein [Lentinula edodes]